MGRCATLVVQQYLQTCLHHYGRQLHLNINAKAYNYSALQQAMNWEVKAKQVFTCMLYIFNSFCSLLTVREQLPGTAGDSFSWGCAMLEYGGNQQCCKEALDNMRKEFQIRTWYWPTRSRQDLFNNLHIILKWGRSFCLWSYHTSPMISETSIKPTILNQEHTTTIPTKRGGSWHHSKLKTHPRTWRLKDSLCQEKSVMTNGDQNWK